MDTVLDFISRISWWQWILIVIVIVAIRDVLQRSHSISHNFPIVGHFRYWLESIGPELRQYLVANNREELPFNRIERGWVYASSKDENNYEGFGTDRDIYAHQHIFVNNAMFPYKIGENHPNTIDKTFLPCAKVMGIYHKRAKPYRPGSVINVSAMSFGSLSAKAIESLNKGVKIAGAYHNTGEGGLSPYHKHGGDVVFHFGTGYFGVRGKDGKFSMEKMKQLVIDNPFIKAIEIKLSQGAKPGKGGVLPGSKISKEIAEIRGVEVGKTVLSPPNHSAFSTVPEMVALIEAIAKETGLPVGIKAAIGKLEQWEELADYMVKTDTGPDFLTIDGGEGGTGAAPPSFADHVSLPWTYAFEDIYELFKRKELCERIVFIGSGKLGFPAKAAMAFAMGADCINVAREAMMSIGCIQAQICHTNRCPSGVATQNQWLQRGINVPLKSERMAQYFKTFRKELIEITHATGYEHPCQFNMADIEMNVDDHNLSKKLRNAYHYSKVPVDFESMQALKDCTYLGGKPFDPDSEEVEGDNTLNN
ncbi:FMN-binding glutamate synthase family protein [Subsaximicrobium wynnwilliamsii]|uniref:FMN-binding glutamate synthase family protein n=1 Tax=Subsaximicrobium wynnwilliamsii TaxID=291179 RepID=A0A5C6ZFI1_9FLAO|nr:FMN-binding glutamate synthase family protein [Subsaximicrobium wynnwilliamsii]TXD82342.1 FMN-binding glutamate synthase family protein [Subsaximicrobium wynnwilliamsii]TXD87980.1 FMN-binding glutamate synthase family protein [Subsaximicrobium wynnwilliamsii]TXE01973.1 FMN-binding glutamate synthase family protein [Subsaximicrobium wynnwilliamsii]